MIDICVNLQNGQFSEDLFMVLKRAHHAGVKGILGCATDLNLAERNIALCTESLKKTQSAPIAVHSRGASS